jgi:conjugal transfer pilus assembly protein TraE
MNFAVMETSMGRLRRARNALGLVSLALIGSNLLLSWQVLQTHSQTILIPSRVSDGMVAQGGGDVRYLEALSLDATQAMYTVSPATTTYSRQVIERVANPIERDALLKPFDEVAEDIKKREISTVFLPEKIDHDLAKLTLTVSGQFATYLGTTRVSEERRTIRVTFSEFGGSVRVARIERLVDPVQGPEAKP